jgi:hypothetical protein
LIITMGSTDSRAPQALAALASSPNEEVPTVLGVSTVSEQFQPVR